MLKPEKSSVLSQFSAIRHGFFNRQNGLSQGIYASLNCGLGSDDNPEHIQKNRKLVADYFASSMDSVVLCTAYQIHSNHCYAITTKDDAKAVLKSPPQCDAFVTNQSNIILGILTADCVPILAYDDNAKVIGAAHAGWKGAFNGVISALIHNMQLLGAKCENIHFAIGAAINQESYEIDAVFFQRFMDSNAGNHIFFKPSIRQDHYHFDLKAYCAEQARRLNINHISISPSDTYQHDDLFYSYRRATHLGQQDYGRQMSAIMMV